MSTGYCLLFQTSNRLYVNHAVYTKNLLLLEGVNKKTIYPKTELIDNIAIEEIVHQNFLHPSITFMTNITRDSFLYKKLKSQLPSSPRIIEELSLEKQNLSRKKLVDCLIGKNIMFDVSLHQRKVFQYLDLDDLSPNLVPYLHLVHYTLIEPLDWLKKLVNRRI